MKGISTILAVILIVIIVVAMISLTYTFAASLIATTTTQTTTQTTTTTERMLKSVTFASASCVFNCSGTNGEDCIKFTIRHTGTVDIKSGELAAFLDDSKIDTTPLTNTSSLTAGGVSSEFAYNTSTNDHKTSRKITVSAPAGEVERTVTCS